MQRLLTSSLLLGFLLLAGLAGAQADELPADAALAPQVEAEAAAPVEPEISPLMVRAGELKTQLEEYQRRVAEDLEPQLASAVGEDAEVLEHQIARAKLEYLNVVSELVDNLEAQREAGIEGAEVRAWVVESLPRLTQNVVQHIDASEAVLRQLRKQRISVDPKDLDSLEDRIAVEIGWLEALLSGYVENLDELERMGIDPGFARNDLRERLSTRADRLAGRIQLTVDKLAALTTRLVDAPDDEGIQADIRLIERRQKTAVAAMTVTVAMMDRVDLDSTAYRQLVIRATGEVTADVFRGKVAVGLVQEGIDSLKSWLLDVGPAFLVKLFFFVMILLAFRVLAALTRKVAVRGVTSANVNASQLVKNMVMGMASRGVMAIGFLVALSQMGVELAPLLAGLGIAGFIVGFALQDSLANFAAGIMILGYRPYDVDDVIEAGGVFGKVSTMSLVSTTILTFDNQTLIVPNAKIWGDVIKNVTNQRDRRVDLEVHVAHSEDVDKARRVLLEVLSSHPKVLEDPEPNVRLHKLLKSSLQFVVRPWVHTEDYWEVYWDITAEIKRRFDAEGIEIPHPKRDVRIIREGGES